MKIATLCLVLSLTGCGRVGAPLPPFIRIPEAVKDLTVLQDGNELILTWTNPARYIDGSDVTDLGRIQIRSNDAVLMEVDATVAGQMQTVSVPVGAAGPSRSFAVTAETTRGKQSQVSNTVSISPVAVPGKVVGLRAVVDQRRIILTWEKPQEHPELADAYRVSRLEPAETQTVPDTRYEDTRYRPGEMYTYQVTAMRGMVPGVGPESVSVLIVDKTPPRIPTGLDIVVSDTGAFVTWAANSEGDLAGYRVFRNGMAVSDRLTTANSFFDPDYRPGFSYAISAVDEFGNESSRSPALRGQ
jgi:hypothetical protein